MDSTKIYKYIQLEKKFENMLQKTAQISSSQSYNEMSREACGDCVGTDQEIKKFTERKYEKLAFFSFSSHFQSHPSELEDEER